MGSLPHEQYLRAKSVCIIGAGPSGLAAAKYLLAEYAFDKITIFEQRANVGGLWNYSELPEDHAQCPVPQTSPDSGGEEPSWYPQDGRDPEFISPLYDRLETNIPRELMGLQDLDWPQQTQLFPKHDETLQYIEAYAEDVKHLVRFRTQVLDVRWEASGQWRVQSKHVSLLREAESVVHEEFYDAVLVASGHFVVPYIPAVDGIAEFAAAHPSVISHSKFYRKPESYAGQKVVIVGNSASGVDIGNQIATVARHPVIYSEKSESFLQPDASLARLTKPHITEFIPEGRKVVFADGTIESDVDRVLYCTGYFYSFPFLPALQESKDPLITTGEHVRNLYQHVFYRPNPTLAFLTLNQKIIPFPTAEAQASVVARVWAGRLALPSESEMKDWEDSWLELVKAEAEEKGKGDGGWGRDVHVLKFPKDADYINMFHDWAVSADGRAARQNDRTQGNAQCQAVGKTPPYWDERAYWMRERFPAIKKAFASFGESRHDKRTLEEVGFSFEQWKREKEDESKRLL